MFTNVPRGKPNNAATVRHPKPITNIKTETADQSKNLETNKEPIHIATQNSVNNPSNNQIVKKPIDVQPKAAPKKETTTKHNTNIFGTDSNDKDNNDNDFFGVNTNPKPSTNITSNKPVKIAKPPSQPLKNKKVNFFLICR